MFLHTRGGDHDYAFGGGLHLDKYLADAVAHGSRPFAIAAADGGDHEYWHPRRGTDPAGMIVHEFLPLLARLGLDVHRIGLLGASMGGYGALYLAERLTRRRVAVMVAESPAIWHEAAQTVEGAFDDAADFARHTIFGAQQPARPRRHRAAHRLRRVRRLRADHRETCVRCCTRDRPAASSRAGTTATSGARRRRPKCVSWRGTCRHSFALPDRQASAPG